MEVSVKWGLEGDHQNPNSPGSREIQDGDHRDGGMGSKVGRSDI